MKFAKTSVLTLAIALTLTACQKTEDVQLQEPVSAGSVPGKPTFDPSGASPGKPSAPISMRYEIISKPVVGQPVQVSEVVIPSNIILAVL